MNKTAQGMYIIIVDKWGQAVARKWFLTVESAQAWLDWQFPSRDRLGYKIEILYN